MHVQMCRQLQKRSPKKSDDGKRPGASVLNSKFSGGGQGGEHRGLADSGGLSHGFLLSKTAKDVSKMVSGHVSDGSRWSQDGPRRRQDSQDGSKALLRRPKTDPKSTKIHEKWM